MYPSKLFSFVILCLTAQSCFAVLGYFEITNTGGYYYGYDDSTYTDDAYSNDCTVDTTCFYSPDYPYDYPANSFCDITVLQNGTLTVQYFDTEPAVVSGNTTYLYDYLDISGYAYEGTVGPEGVEVFKGEHIYFFSDFNAQYSGFVICMNVPMPSPQPTPVPTPAPTPVCDRGSYISSLTHTCEVCEAGRYANVSGHTSNCTLCAAGYFQANEASTACVACSSGLSTEDRTDCRACVAGEYALDNIECVSCEVGRYAPTAQVDSCLECYAGDATNNITGSTACSSCQAGTYSEDLASYCIDCHAGTYSSTRSSFCVDCVAGTYAAVDVSSTCTDCSAGTVSNTSASVCKDCAVGRSQGLTGQSTCILCSAGTFAPFIARTSCSDCDVGKYAKNEGSVNCTKCDVGYYQGDTASTACVACDVGTYSYNKASVDCTACGTGLNSAVGSSECDLAASGYYIDTDATSKQCPTGALCAGRYELPKPRDNFWCNRKKLATVTDFEKCTRNTCTGGGGNASCWLPTSFSLSNGDGDDGECDSDNLQCLEGSFGPLCGACSDGYTFTTSTSTCVSCNGTANRTPLIITLIFCLLLLSWIVIMMVYREKTKDSIYVKQFMKLSLVRLLAHVDMGMARVAWSTYQIISSISWNLNVTYPQPFRSLLGALSFLQLDFLTLDCVSGKASFYGRVYTMSIGPMVAVFFNVLAYFFRVNFSTPGNIAKMRSQHAYIFLLITYLVLPPVSMIHFQSLNCLTLSDGSSYLRSDTSISCDNDSYANFAGVVGLFIFIYQSMPLLWLLLLWRNRKRIDPLGSSEGRDPVAALAVAMDSRNQDSKISYLRFLWDVYLPRKWYFEVVDMYRRILFIGVLPLLGTGSLRATIGCFLSIILAAYFREANPYVRNTTNILAVVAQYQILANFFGALVILSDSLALFGLADFGLGCLLFAANLFILILCGGWCYDRYCKEEEASKWRRVLTTKENNILSKIMNDEAIDKTDWSDGEKTEQRSVSLLERYLLKPCDVILDKKIGAGAFGEVFKGTCLGEVVAIKTMKDVTEENAKSFKAEILLNSHLKHPNIVNFVGACWSRELTCLVLEWVSGGSLQGLLDDVTQNLTWSEPLLRLTCDVARGMAWLHQRKYFDEREDKHCTCIVHRDLKPDNVLVTEFMNGKITDFGTSRALSDSEITMTAVGTPIFCAPEVMRGEIYDEKVDVYAFGMSLMSMAMEENLLDFLRARWCVWNNKLKPPKQPMRIIRPMVEDGWRPVSAEDPIQFAPPSINGLIIRCCDSDQTKRPSFYDIITLLDTITTHEVNRQNYYRYGAEGHTAAFRKDRIELEDEADADEDMAYPSKPVKQPSFAATASNLMKDSMAAITPASSSASPRGRLNPMLEDEEKAVTKRSRRKSNIGMELTDINSGTGPSAPSSGIVTAFTEL